VHFMFKKRNDYPCGVVNLLLYSPFLLILSPEPIDYPERSINQYQFRLSLNIENDFLDTIYCVIYSIIFTICMYGTAEYAVVRQPQLL
jgi:hypothetical protein